MRSNQLSYLAIIFYCHRFPLIDGAKVDDIFIPCNVSKEKNFRALVMSTFMDTLRKII